MKVIIFPVIITYVIELPKRNVYLVMELKLTSLKILPLKKNTHKTNHISLMFNTFNL